MGQAALGGGQPLEAAGDVLRDIPISAVPEETESDGASKIMKGIGSIPAPQPVFAKQLIDPMPFHGPCGDEVYSFEGWTLAAKQRWSMQCQAFWDCQSCERDYQVACPQSWAPVEGALRCSPLGSYHGPCRGIADFSGYNAAMKEQWSSQCGAFWACEA